MESTVSIKSVSIGSSVKIRAASIATLPARITIERDSRSLDILLVVADFSEQLRRPKDAIGYRLRIDALDPWNGKNHLQLARLYVAQGETERARFFIDKLMAFAAATPEGETAKSEFKELIGS